MKEMILYFVDDTLEIVYNNKTFSFKLKDIIYQGQIIDKDLFYVEFNKILKTIKIRSKLFGDKIYVVKEPFYLPSYLFFLNHILEDVGFVKIEYISIKDLFSESDGVNIEINKSYMVIHNEKNIFIDLNIFKDIPKVIDYCLNNEVQNVFLFGKNKDIPLIQVNNIDVYYYENYGNYIIESLTKIKKYGV